MCLNGTPFLFCFPVPNTGVILWILTAAWGFAFCILEVFFYIFTAQMCWNLQRASLHIHLYWKPKNYSRKVVFNCWSLSRPCTKGMKGLLIFVFGSLRLQHKLCINFPTRSTPTLHIHSFLLAISLKNTFPDEVMSRIVSAFFMKFGVAFGKIFSIYSNKTQVSCCWSKNVVNRLFGFFSVQPICCHYSPV